MSISENREPRTPSQRRLLKTDVPGIYKRGTRYVAITQFRGKRVKTYHRTKAEARRAKAERTAGARPTSREPFERYAERWLVDYRGRTSLGLSDSTRAAYAQIFHSSGLSPTWKTCLGRAPPPPLVWLTPQTLFAEGGASGQRDSSQIERRGRQVTMRIAVFGRGNVGGGLADLWERAGHQVTRLGRNGGDVSAADAVLLAVPGGAIGEALDRLTGVEGKTMIDATNLYGVVPPGGFASNAEFVKSRTGGPTAKSFNINFASLYDRLLEARVRPSNLWCGDEEAREVVEQLNRDAGYDPVHTGPIENAAAQERVIDVIFAIGEEMGPYVYRFAPVEQL